jgi:hypothetical protein
MEVNYFMLLIGTAITVAFGSYYYFGEKKSTNPIKKQQMAELNSTDIARIKKDKEVRQAYVANIAMAFYDEHARYKKKTGKKSLSKHDIITVANTAAENFMRLLCDEIKAPKGR